MQLLMLAWRNLWRHRRRTVITTVTIAVGFALAVVAIGLGDGAHNDMIRNAIRLGEGHLAVQPEGYQAAPANHVFLHEGRRIATQLAEQDMPGRVVPRIDLQVLASTANNNVGAGLKGIDLQDDLLVERLAPNLVAGRWPENHDTHGVVIGVKMADKLKAKVGTKMVVMGGRPDGESYARLARVRGIFRTGIDELDGFFIAGGLEFARPFLTEDEAVLQQEPVTRYAIFLADPEAMAEWKGRLRALPLPDRAVVLDWQEMMPQLVNFIALDDAGNYIWLLFVLVMVAFGILNTILMSVLERTREFGLLRALGMRAGRLLALVFTETILMALLALGVGWALATAGHLYFAIYGLDLTFLGEEALSTAGTMMDPVMNSELSWGRIVSLTAIVFVTTLVSGLYPAIKASRISPIQALQT